MSPTPWHVTCVAVQHRSWVTVSGIGFHILVHRQTSDVQLLLFVSAVMIVAYIMPMQPPQACFVDAIGLQVGPV